MAASMESADLSGIEHRLWNDDVQATFYGNDVICHQAAILEQYKLYVDMADKLSQRRSFANTFFLTLNTSAAAAVGVSWSAIGQLHTAWVAPVLLILTIQCLTWFHLVRSYRLLSTAKFVVIGGLEQRLPSSPYWRAEWYILGGGKDRSKYWPLSHIEQTIPVSFALIYIFSLVFAFVS